MKNHIATAKDWWMHLAPREKKSIIGAVVTIGFFSLYQFYWVPFTEKNQTLRKKIDTNTQTHVWMLAADEAIRKQEKKETHGNLPQISSPVILLGMMQKQIEQAGLTATLTQLKQASNDSIEMHFQKIEFDQLLKLLVHTFKNQRVVVSQMGVAHESEPGVVNADITLKLS